MSLFDDFDWGGLAKSIIPAVPGAIASAVGARTVAKGNAEAARVAAATGAQNTALIQDAANRSTVAREPAIAHFRAQMGQDPSVMTPAQTIAINDAQRTLNNKNLLGTVGGRAFSRIHADTTGRLRANAVKENQQRVDNAASQVGNLAGQESNTALNVAQGLSGINNNAASAQANAITGTAASNADTYGQIANMFANVVKDQDRESRYEEYKTRRV